MSIYFANVVSAFGSDWLINDLLTTYAREQVSDFTDELLQKQKISLASQAISTQAFSNSYCVAGVKNLNRTIHSKYMLLIVSSKPNIFIQNNEME